MLSILIAFLTVYVLMPWFIRYFTRIGLVVKDQHKMNKPLIPLSGGIVVFFGIFFAVMFIIFVETFYYHNDSRLIYLLAFITSIFAITFIGFIDDLLVRKDYEASIGLKQWQKPLLTVIAAIPLMVINAGETIVSLPFFGAVNFGILYPLILIPIGVVGASNMVNLLAGFNGLESGLALIYLSNLGVYAYVNGMEIAALIGAVSFAAVLAFWYFNFVPAKIFPGDSLTYLLGGVIVSMAILGNMETAALIVSIPFFIEVILKLRGRFKKQSYGFYFNGKVKSLYDKIYSLPHIMTLSGKFTEKQVVLFVYCLEAVCCFLIWII